jgi:hypothetical protein
MRRASSPAKSGGSFHRYLSPRNDAPIRVAAPEMNLT